ncbi:hypothetical protein KZ779_11525 [Escherichia coli]|nr:hypothetical protein [Escherichia coli]
MNGATSLYDEVIIINKIPPPKKIDTKGVATEEVATKKSTAEQITDNAIIE